MRYTVFLDVDETLRMLTEAQGEQGEKIFVLNQNLIDQLKKHGITEINFFTNMSPGEISTIDQDLNPEEHCLSRAYIIRELEKQGFTVKAVITPADIGHAQGVGAAYSDLYTPAYNDYFPLKGQTQNKETLKANQATWIGHGTSLYTDAPPMANDEKAAYQKGKMFEYFVAESKKKGTEIGTVLYFDDDKKCLKKVKGLAHAQGIPIVTVEIEPEKLKEQTEAKLEQRKYADAIALACPNALAFRVLNEYKAHTEGIFFSIIHRHGSTGIKRAENFLTELEQCTLEDRDQKIITYLSEKKNGNTNPHSFRTMLLATLLRQELTKENLKDVSAHYNEKLLQFTSIAATKNYKAQRQEETVDSTNPEQPNKGSFSL